MQEHDVKNAEEILKKSDPVLQKLINGQTLVLRFRSEDYFESLCRSIIGQQVSVAAAAAIFTRFSDITKLDHDAVAKLGDEDAKIIGLSRQKTSYLKDLAAHFVDDPDIYNHLDSLADEAVITELAKVRGIGVWTAQMFLMFTLHRPDVFAPDDVGLQRAMMWLYGWQELPTKAELLEVAEKWSPYRTIASFHLWQSLSNVPPSSAAADPAKVSN